jgi:hypothetical protein
MAEARTTSSDDIHARVRAVVDAQGVSQAEAIRLVAKETGRTPSSTSSAYYAAARRARTTSPQHGATSSASTTSRRTARTATRHHSELYAEMLPLVEAGASAEQAARRFGQDEDVAAIAAGFEAWRGGAAPEGDSGDSSSDPGARRRQGDAAARLASLEAENRILRAELGRANQTIARIRAIVEAAES